MYLSYFGLSEKPFSITPDPRFLYLSDKHREGMAHLLYGADQSGSFAVLTGEVGTGKTTLCRSMLAQAPDKVVFALILNPLQTPLELLSSICDEFQIDYPTTSDSRKDRIDALNKWLLEVHARGERAVVIIDEAQNLSVETLEQVRLLTNLETSSEKLLKIILIGQPELKTILARPDLRQLKQRITARYHLDPLAEADAEKYVGHRLKIAGASRNFFSPAAIKTGYRQAQGIPRLMNLIFDRALTGAYGKNQATIEPAIVRQAAKELFAHDTAPNTNRQSRTLVITAVIATSLITAGIVAWFALNPKPELASDIQQVPQTPDIEVTENLGTPNKPLPQPQNFGAKDAENTDAGANGDFSELGPVSPEKVSLNHLLTHNADNNNAFKALFKLWQLDFNDYVGDSACQRARNANYRCTFGGDGSLSTLITAQLPAVLELKTPGGELRQVTLENIDGTQLTVDIAGTLHQVPSHELTELWNGSYMLIWPTPPGDNLTISPRDSGAAVLWLRQQLQQLNSQTSIPTDLDNETYDDALRQQVTTFQRNQSLKADGIAGEQTLLQLAKSIYQTLHRSQ